MVCFSLTLRLPKRTSLHSSYLSNGRERILIQFLAAIDLYPHAFCLPCCCVSLLILTDLHMREAVMGAGLFRLRGSDSVLPKLG